MDRRSHWFVLSGEDIDRTVAWLDRHGHAAVGVCRLIPALRTVALVPAGLVRMPLAPFLLYSAASTMAWTAALAYAGRLLGANEARVRVVLGPAPGSWSAR
ncbi:DedA family protein [Roseisolibacter agri]|uniref:VTT domain-containing protein n=1 Tax=Roseisolibacter agri TaxID=2014610 RepID=A0AA37V4P2_9BACT|nr:VTT domain-containing protein [Roseisolibacter agri]GLC28197.1 hypothetical protein rosag_47100 [Roseisolibacter agri]